MHKYIGLACFFANSLLLAHTSIDQLPVIDENQCEQESNHSDDQIHQYFENFFGKIIEDCACAAPGKAKLLHISFQIMYLLNSDVIQKRMTIEEQLNWYRWLVQYIIITLEVNIAESQYIYDTMQTSCVPDEDTPSSIKKLLEKRLSDMQTKAVNNNELLHNNFEILDLLSSKNVQKELPIQEQIEYNRLLVQSMINALSQTKNA